MIILGLIGVPLTIGLVLFLIRQDVIRRSLLLMCSGIHLVLTFLAWIQYPVTSRNGWFALDPLGMIFLSVTSLLFFGTSLYAVQYLSDEKRSSGKDERREAFFSVEAIFSGCFLFFLASMTMVVACQHLALQWAAIEATTLATAPLIYFHRTKSSLEATWKYLLICSVGIALALLGVFFLAVAKSEIPGELILSEMIRQASRLHVPWLKAAFLFLFVGYGTKMGLAPLHTWLPDAHSEAPSVISALLSGALLNCALLGILRGYQIGIAAGLQSYGQHIFIVFGLVSVLFAAIFILGQTDFKRMLAYSSVEHMGIISLGIGVGAGAINGAIINTLGHSFTKAGLFMIAGNLLSYYRTKKIAHIRGLMHGPQRGIGTLWLSGFLLISGMPPSGIFLGKWLILKEILSQNQTTAAVLFLASLALIFVGMARIFISMTQGTPSDKAEGDGPFSVSFFRLFPSMIFFGMAVWLGIYLPAWLSPMISAAVTQLGGG